MPCGWLNAAAAPVPSVKPELPHVPAMTFKLSVLPDTSVPLWTQWSSLSPVR